MRFVTPLPNPADATESVPWPVQIHQEKGRALLAEGDFAAAAAELKAALAEGGSDPLLHLQLATAQMHLAEWMPAGSALMHYLRARPADPLAHVRMGIVLRNLHKYDLAQRQFRRALKLDPHCVPALAQLGEHAAAARDFTAATAHFQQALALHPTHVPALLGMAELCAARDFPAQAAEWFESALAAASPAQQAQIFARYGKFLTAQKRWHEAAAAYAQAMQRGHDHPEARYEYALACLQTGQRELAAQQAQLLATQRSHLGSRLRQIMSL